MSTAIRRRDNLFLGTLDEFTFDFAGGNERSVVAAAAVTGEETKPRDTIAIVDSAQIEDEGITQSSSSTTLAERQKPLDLNEVMSLFVDSLEVGGRYFALPQNAPSWEHAAGQYLQSVQRSAHLLKQEHKEKLRKEKAQQKKKRERE